MRKTANPYRGRPEKAFWIPSVAEKHFSEIDELWQPFALQKTAKVATAGSCFAQHIGRNLKARGASYMDYEPAPPFFSDGAAARRFGYGIFSCRYGNIYTSRQLVQLFQEAFGMRSPLELVWSKQSRFFDALRPGVNPVGHTSVEQILAARKDHLNAVRQMFEEVDLFVFTMGLTEGWEAKSDQTMYPMAPGTACGEFDSSKYEFRNLRVGEVSDDMLLFRRLLREVNPTARILLTVSPVPLMATASDQHVLLATSYSKSVLRAVAGEMAEDCDNVFYFPSFEIISTHPFRGSFFEPDLREVNQMGVNLVMDHFFTGPLAAEFANGSHHTEEEVDLVCDEASLDLQRGE